MDEMPKQLLANVREPVACQPGAPARQDYEFKHHGVEDLFMLFEPLQGKRYVDVKERRRRVEWACVIKSVPDEVYPQAEKIVVVLDNLNIHAPVSFYETFEPDEARRLTEHFESHFTPKHGSWLNMAEIELRVLARQCLDRRIPNKEILIQELTAWQHERNDEVDKVL
jgi:hypothetical protein